jgi:hypothetical protein
VQQQQKGGGDEQQRQALRAGRCMAVMCAIHLSRCRLAFVCA